MPRTLRFMTAGLVLATSAVLLVPVGANAKPMASGDVAAPSSSTSTLSRATTARLDAALREAWAELPGGALATVIVPGRGTWTGSVGYANDKRGLALTPQMQSPIGSVTKTFTGMLVLQEIAAGRLALEDRLSRWYPQVPKSDEISIEMLLNMSSGIADYLNSDIPTIAKQLMADPGRRYRPDVLIAKGAKLPRVFDEPGSSLAYSNTNTVILGRILEKATGMSYGDLLESRLFGPLGLTRSFLDDSGKLEAPHAQTYSGAFGLDPRKPPVGRATDWSQSIVWSAGGLASTIGDLGRWGRVLGTGEGVIPASLADERLEKCAPSSPEAAKITVEYCLGAVVVRDNATRRPITVWHNGRVFGAVAYVGYYPATGAVVAVMANSDLEGPNGEHVSMRGKAGIEEAIPGLLGLGTAN